MSKKLGLLCSILLMFASTGCGISIPSLQSGTPKSNAPFVNKLQVELVKPYSTQNAATVDPKKYERVHVYTEDGQSLNLNFNKQPVLVEAYWCPHCQRTLVMFRKNQSSIHTQPVIVSSGFSKGTSLKDAVKLTKTEFSKLGLGDFKVYYYLGSYQTLTPHIPGLFYQDNGKPKLLIGEHTLPVWEKSLS